MIPQRSREARPCTWIIREGYRLSVRPGPNTFKLRVGVITSIFSLSRVCDQLRQLKHSPKALTSSGSSASVSSTYAWITNGAKMRDVASELDINIEFISTEAKRAKRAERAIRTAKNHIIATRAGFHPDFTHAFLDKCLPQMELALNIIHPFEYDDSISAHESIHHAKFDFK